MQRELKTKVEKPTLKMFEKNYKKELRVYMQYLTKKKK
jgi:hypothetical protein